MKKILSIILAAVICFTGLCAIADESNAALRVAGYGIMQGDEGGMRLEDNITRAEFAAVVCRIRGVFEAGAAVSSFSDVPAEHWASGFIGMAKSMGIVNGMGNGLFEPESFVTYNEAVKMVVCLLGYGFSAEQKGGWPAGYLAEAGTLGLLKSVDMTAEFAKRGEIVKIIDAALDTEVIIPEYGKENSYIKAGYTLAESLSRPTGAVYFKGIMTECGFLSATDSISGYSEGRILIDNSVFYTDKDLANLFGQAVSGWAKEEDDGKMHIVSIAANNYLNKIESYDAENVVIKSGGAQCFGESAIEEEITFEANPIYILNGRKVMVPDSYLSSDTAVFTFIDNNGNGNTDMIFISDSKSFVIEKISTKNSFVYFADDKYFKGKRGYELLSTDKNRSIGLYDSEGTPIEFSQIKEGDVITIAASEDEALVSVWVSCEKISGIVSEVESDGRVLIGGNWYESLESLAVGDEGEFSLDKNGAIVAVSKTKSSDMKYGYIADAEFSEGINRALTLLIIEEGTVQKEVKEVSGAEQISYYLQNAGEKIYYCSEKIRFAEDYTYSVGNTTDTLLINPENLKGKAAAFKCDADGKISALNIYSVPSIMEKCSFNAEIFAFGGESVSRGYMADEETKVICVPSALKVQEDYGVRVYITNAASYFAYGINCISEYDPTSDEYKREAVDVLILKTDMDSTRPYPVQSDSDICMVGEFCVIADENGEEKGKIEMLCGEEIITKYINTDSAAYSAAKALRMGDLIQFVADGDGTVANIKKLASVQGLRTHSSNGDYYGVASDVHYDTYDYLSNKMCDLIEISFDNGAGNKSIKMFNDEQQYVYHYNRARGYIETATTDDILTSVQSGGSASKIFALMERNDALCLVIISD